MPVGELMALKTDGRSTLPAVWHLLYLGKADSMRGSGLFLILPSIWPCCLISSRNTFTFYDGEFHGEYFEYLGAKQRGGGHYKRDRALGNGQRGHQSRFFWEREEAIN